MELMYGRNCSCKDQSNTWALSMAQPRSMEEISQPIITSIIMKFQQNLCVLPPEFSEGSVHKTAYTAIFERYQSIIHLHLYLKEGF